MNPTKIQNYPNTVKSAIYTHTQQYTKTLLILKFPLLRIHSETLILAAGLTDIISRMPTPPGKMKKTNHYVQWQQLKQLHKATYVGSYKPLVSRVGLRVSTELWTFLSEPSLAETSTLGLKLSRPKPAQTDTARWKGLTQCVAWEQDSGLWDCALVRSWVCVFICIFLEFAFSVCAAFVCVFRHVCVFFALWLH